MKVVQWMNENSGCIMTILTLVYVLATIVICYFNYKSAKATREQTEESYKQFIENNRGHIIPKIVEIEGEMLCLAFQNIGLDIATDVIINVKEEWLKKLGETKTFPEVANSLRILKEKKIFLTVDQKLCYGLCVPGNGFEDFKKLGEETLNIKIEYKTLNKLYKEEFNMPLDAYNYMVNQSDYVRLTKKQIQESKKTNEELEKIAGAIKNIS